MALPPVHSVSFTQHASPSAPIAPAVGPHSEAAAPSPASPETGIDRDAMAKNLAELSAKIEALGPMTLKDLGTKKGQAALAPILHNLVDVALPLVAEGLITFPSLSPQLNEPLNLRLKQTFEALSNTFAIFQIDMPKDLKEQAIKAALSAPTPPSVIPGVGGGRPTAPPSAFSAIRETSASMPSHGRRSSGSLAHPWSGPLFSQSASASMSGSIPNPSPPRVDSPRVSASESAFSFTSSSLSSQRSPAGHAEQYRSDQVTDPDTEKALLSLWKDRVTPLTAVAGSGAGSAAVGDPYSASYQSASASHHTVHVSFDQKEPLPPSVLGPAPSAVPLASAGVIDGEFIKDALMRFGMNNYGDHPDTQRETLKGILQSMGLEINFEEPGAKDTIRTFMLGLE